MIVAVKPPVSDIASFLIFFKNCEERNKNFGFKFFLFETKFINGFQFVKYEVLLPKIFWLGLLLLLLYPFLMWKALLIIGIILYLPVFFWSSLWVRLVLWLGLSKAKVKGYKVVKLEKAIGGAFFNESE